MVTPFSCTVSQRRKMDADKQPKSVISLPSSHSDDLMVLRTRVAQQSELISMLKTRSDKTLLEVRA